MGSGWVLTRSWQHVGTGKLLHSHLVASPISNNQEVSCYGHAGSGDTGDNWVVQCVTETIDKTWYRDAEVCVCFSLRRGMVV